MPSSSSPDLSAICLAILQYLHDHPEAADNLEGIAAWWLPPMGHDGVSPEVVQEALAALVAERRIARIDVADGRALYQSVEKVSGSHLAWRPQP